MTTSPWKDRFPGLRDGWVRFDGPAGTQVADSVVEAIREHLESGESANVHGAFAASAATGTLMTSARSTVGRLLGADAAGIVFGPNMTTLTFAFTRAVARTLGPGDEVVGTRLDHDANVTPWALACADRGATMHLADVDPATGRLDMAHLTSLVGERTRWIAVTGASNAVGTMPDLVAIVDLARSVGARVYVDAVHLVPHRAVDVARIGCDALACSPYKWYGPHAGVLWMKPQLLADLAPYKVRPSPDEGPERWETGTAAFELIAGVRAAADLLLELGMPAIVGHETSVFRPLLSGLLDMPHVTVHGPQDITDRAPTLAFTVDGITPQEVAQRLADDRIAVWAGNYYAVELFQALGLQDGGGAVRVGVSCYTGSDDVDRLLESVAALKR